MVAAVDLSAISPAVVRTGARLAARLGGECLVVHVVEALSGDEESATLLPSLRRWVARVRQEARDGLDRLLAQAAPEPAAAPLRGEVLEGRAFAQLARRARQQGARLVVVGGPPPSRLLGATAERVIRKSPVPVLVVRRPPPAGYRSLLVGVDFSEGAGRALAEALSLAEPGARVTACHVLDTKGFPRSEEVARALEELRGRVRSWAAATTAPVEVRVEAGRPRDVLLEVAAATSADLLAVGSRGRGRVSHLLLGSVSEAACRRAPCDVLVAGAGLGRPREEVPC